MVGSGEFIRCIGGPYDDREVDIQLGERWPWFDWLPGEGYVVLGYYEIDMEGEELVYRWVG